MKNVKNRRRISRWNAISIVDSDNNITNYFILDEYGKLKNKFQKLKPRNLNLLMNPHIALRNDNSDASEPESLPIPTDNAQPEQPIRNAKINLELHNCESFYCDNSISLKIEENNQNKIVDDFLSDVFLPPSQIGDAQWCIDYVTSHLLA